ncbi:unnamed protein product, partial [Laminaria digitata]
QELSARDPKEVEILEVLGGLSGVNVWPELRVPLDEVDHENTSQAFWTKHACDGCRKDTDIEGGPHSVQAASVDGLTATRHIKYKIRGCTLDLPGLGGHR